MIRFLAAGVLCVLPSLASSQVAPPGAESCSGCHGIQGTALPALAQLSADQISAAMADFRKGAREATVMDRIAKGFSEAETEAIAKWLAAHERRP